MAETEHFFEELQSAYLYEVMAAREKGSARSALFKRLAHEARSQADIWKKKLSAEGVQVSETDFTPTLRARLVARLIGLLGPRAIMPVLAAMKVRGISVYQSSVHGDEKQLHRAINSGGNLRAAVFGLNDGLVSNASLVLGVLGAGAESDVLLMSGAAGLMAGAFSMAAGEYISVKTQRELYEYQIGLERDELKTYPDEEAQELALIYEAKGFSASEAEAMSKKMISDPERALDTLAREELGLNPQELGSPWRAALYSFVSFALGALVPLIAVISFSNPLFGTIVLSASALFIVGLSMSLFTGRSALWSACRMLVIGCLAGGVTYGLGLWFGVSVS